MKTLEANKGPLTNSAKPQDAAVTGTRAIDFVGDVKDELRKISWTNPEELKVYTKIVVGTTFVLGMAIYLVDLVIQTFLSGLSAFVHWIF